MELNRLPLVVTFEVREERKAIINNALAGASDVVYITELDDAARADALRNAGVLLTFNTSKELRSGEVKLLGGARLIQFMIAGVDFIPLRELPEGVPVATNGGGYAEAMAEHVTGALPQALAAEGVEVWSLVPGYPAVMKAFPGEAVHHFDELFGGPAELLVGRVQTYFSACRQI
jgi:hypothetical protein